VLTTDADIEHGGQLRAGAVRQAVDGSDDRLAESRQVPIRLTANLGARSHLLRRRFDHLHNVAAGGEGARAGTGENDRPNLIVAFYFG
jgi:hypothetical protein